MCRVIAVSNQKGGVGKTVSCVNLGIGLAQEGKKVLLIDADPQGSLTISLGYEEPDEMEYSLATLMMNIVNDEKLNIEKTILHHKEGVDLIPANIELSAIEVSLVNAMSRELILRSMVDRLREFYDYIIIDCMPSLGMMTINALACADSVLIPVQAAYLPVKGLQQLIKTIGRVKKQLNPKLKIEGILLTMVDNRTNYARDISLMVYDTYSASIKVFGTEIPMSVRASEVSVEGGSIYSYDPKGKAAFAYIPDFTNIGKGIEKIRIPVTVILFAIMIPAFLAQSHNEYFYGSSEKTEEGSDTWDIEQKFGTANSSVLMVPRGESNKETLLCEELQNIDHVTAVTSYATMVSNKIPDIYLDQSVVDQFYSENYARIIISADCAYEGTDSFTMVENIKNAAQKYYPDEFYLCGQSANMYDIKEFSQQDNKVVTLITVICIYLVLLIMTKNWFTPFLLILTIECSIWLNMSIPYFMGDKLSYLGYLIVSTVQMGATIDYAILLIGNFSEDDYQAVSFTDAKNENITSVQFVISSKGIEKAKIEKATETEKKEGFFDRLKALFVK